MLKKLLVTADLGHLKVFRLEEDERFSVPRIELLGQHNSEVTHHLSEEISDRFGQFRRGSGPSDATSRSDGQKHNLSLERRRRALKNFAGHISNWVRKEEPESVYLAAARNINQHLIEALGSEVIGMLQKNVFANLTKTSTSQLASRFHENSKSLQEA